MRKKIKKKSARVCTALTKQTTYDLKKGKQHLLAIVIKYSKRNIYGALFMYIVLKI